MFQILALYMGSLILRSIAIAAIAGSCAWKIRNVAMRHAVWVAVLVAMLLMPAVDYLMPASWVPARVKQIAAEQPVAFRVVSAGAVANQPSKPIASQAPAVMPARTTPVNWWSIAAALYALVALAMFMRLAMGYRKMWQLRRTGRTIVSSVWEEMVVSHRKRWRMTVLLESELVRVPMTVGLVRPAVILPIDWKTWDEWKLRAVLLHEAAHIRRGDWGIAVVAAAVKCAYWLNPLSWFLERKLSQLAEHASDDASLSRNKSTTRYAEILLEFAAATQSGGRLLKGGVAMAQQNMKARIERVLGKPQSGTGFVRIVGWTLVMILAIPVIYSATALQVASESTPSLVPNYVWESGRSPLPQPTAAGPQTVTQSAPVTESTLQQNSPNPAADPRVLSQQMEIVKQQLQQARTANEFFQEVQKYNQSFAFTSQEPQNAAERLNRGASLQEELIRAQARQRALEAEIEMRKSAIAQQEQQLVNQPNPPERQLEQLKANYAALEASRAEIAKLSRSLEEIRPASVSFEKTESKSKTRIFVTGKVKTAGAYEFDEPLTVLQALALAGGIQEFARMDAITITRMNGNTSTLFRFTYSEVIRGVNTSQNIYLENGDVVVVP